MVPKTLFVIIIVEFSVAVKVNLQGRITLGKDVMDTLSYFIDQSSGNSRRMMSLDPENDVIAGMVTSKQLCVDLQFCSGHLEQFVDNYIILLANAMESIIKTSSAKETFQKFYPDNVDKILRDVRKMLKNVDGKISEDKKFYYWNSIIKKISAKFQYLVTSIITNLPKSDFKNNISESKSLVQKLITAIVVIEHKYGNKLCAEHKICIKSFACTTTLHDILNKLINLPEGKVRYFMKNLYEALFATTFYSSLSGNTAQEFQIILKNMAISNKVPTKSLLESVEKTVETRLELIKNHKDLQLGYDVLLIHMILSDMDHFYSTHKQQPLLTFTRNFEDWTRNSHLGKHLREAVKEIGYEVSSQSKEIILKLTNEVRVFLELTVDPEQ